MVYEIKSTAEFTELVVSGKKVIIHFYSDSCESCERCKPVALKFQSLSDDYDDIEFVKVNVDEQPRVMGIADACVVPSFQACYQGNTRGEFRKVCPVQLRQFIAKVHRL
ncbi:hypothetical protein BGX29_002542 [Mortierella sp. GBA35]|nr:hypothetical protein BGX29_002542 [Mortierella sp. GBA35]